LREDDDDDIFGEARIRLQQRHNLELGKENRIREREKVLRWWKLAWRGVVLIGEIWEWDSIGVWSRHDITLLT
jgi:hypothetical protein